MNKKILNFHHPNAKKLPQIISIIISNTFNIKIAPIK